MLNIVSKASKKFFSETYHSLDIMQIKLFESFIVDLTQPAIGALMYEIVRPMSHTCLFGGKLSITWFASELMLTREPHVLFQGFKVDEPTIALAAVFLGHVGSETIWSAQGSERLKRVYSLPGGRVPASKEVTASIWSDMLSSFIVVSARFSLPLTQRYEMKEDVPDKRRKDGRYGA